MGPTRRSQFAGSRMRNVGNRLVSTDGMLAIKIENSLAVVVHAQVSVVAFQALWGWREEKDVQSNRFHQYPVTNRMGSGPLDTNRPSRQDKMPCCLGGEHALFA